MRDANVRNHLKYICSVCFADGDSDGHFNFTVKAIIDLKLYKSVKFIFSAASVVNHSYSNVETNMLSFLYGFFCLPLAGLTLWKIPRSTLWLPLTIFSDNKFKRTAPLGHLVKKSSLLMQGFILFIYFLFLKLKDCEK